MPIMRANQPGSPLHALLRKRQDGDEASRSHGGTGVWVPLSLKTSIKTQARMNFSTYTSNARQFRVTKTSALNKDPYLTQQNLHKII